MTQNDYIGENALCSSAAMDERPQSEVQRDYIKDVSKSTVFRSCPS